MVANINGTVVRTVSEFVTVKQIDGLLMKFGTKAIKCQLKMLILILQVTVQVASCTQTLHYILGSL